MFEPASNGRLPLHSPDPVDGTTGSSTPVGRSAIAVGAGQISHRRVETALSGLPGRRPVQAGELVVVTPDLVMAHDSLAPGILRASRGSPWGLVLSADGLPVGLQLMSAAFTEKKLLNLAATIKTGQNS